MSDIVLDRLFCNGLEDYQPTTPIHLVQATLGHSTITATEKNCLFKQLSSFSPPHCYQFTYLLGGQVLMLANDESSLLLMNAQ